MVWLLIVISQKEKFVYMFSFPNSTKQVCDYETADPQAIIDAATLKEIKKTWSDPDKVRIARQHLAQVLYGGSTEKKKSDFRFVVDDNAVYHTLSDFRSKEARQMYASFLQKEKDLASLEESLTNLRAAYQQSNKAGKEKNGSRYIRIKKNVPTSYDMSWNN